MFFFFQFYDHGLSYSHSINLKVTSSDVALGTKGGASRTPVIFLLILILHEKMQLENVVIPLNFNIFFYHGYK